MKKSLWVIPAFVLLCFVVGCQDKAAMAELEKYKAQAAVEEQNKALLARFYDAYAKGDIAAIKEICPPAYVSWSGKKSYSFENLIENINVNKETFSDITFVIEDIIASGDRVAARYTVRGTHRGSNKEGEPIIAEGTKIELTNFDIERFENGKIVEGWDGQDNLSLYEQLGYELKPKEVKKK